MECAFAGTGCTENRARLPTSNIERHIAQNGHILPCHRIRQVMHFLRRVFTTEIGKKEKASQPHWRSAHSHTSNHLSTRQCARIVKGRVNTIGLDPAM